MENDIDRRSFLDQVFLRQDYEPRNSTEIDPSALVGLSVVEENEFRLEKDIRAFETTQRNVSFGIIAAGGLLQTIIKYPEEPNELVRNFVTPAVIQVLNYASFKIGLSAVSISVEKAIEDTAIDANSIEDKKSK